MKQNKLIRSDKPHSVNMPEGSNVAARQSTQKFKASDAVDESPTHIQKAAPVKNPKIKDIEAPVQPAKKVRAKAAKGLPIEAPTQRVKPKPATGKTARPKPKLRSAQAQSRAKTKAPAQDAAPAPVVPVWEKDNPVKTRIDQLISRNAQLAEQLQRLPQMPIARGKRP
jgi:hypothetical protein